MYATMNTVIHKFDMICVTRNHLLQQVQTLSDLRQTENRDCARHTISTERIGHQARQDKDDIEYRNRRWSTATMQAPIFFNSSSPRILETQSVFWPSFPRTLVPHRECATALGLPEEFLCSPAVLKSCRENNPVDLTGDNMQAM